MAIFIRLNFFNPQFLFKKYLMLKNLSPYPKGLPSRVRLYRVWLTPIYKQNVSNPKEEIEFELRFSSIKFIESIFLP